MLSQTSHSVRQYIGGKDWTSELPYSLVSVASGRLLSSPSHKSVNNDMLATKPYPAERRMSCSRVTQLLKSVASIRIFSNRISSIVGNRNPTNLCRRFSPERRFPKDSVPGATHVLDSSSSVRVFGVCFPLLHIWPACAIVTEHIRTTGGTADHQADRGLESPAAHRKPASIQDRFGPRPGSRQHASGTYFDAAQAQRRAGAGA